MIVASARLGQHELDRLVEAVGADELGARLLGELAEVAGQRLGGLLALEVGEALDAVVAVADDQHGLGRDVGLGEVVLLLARVGDADLVDDGVVALGVETGDQAVPLAFDEFGLDAELGGDRFADLDVEADELAAVVMIGEGRVGALGADLEDAGGLDGGEVFAGNGGKQRGGLNEGCGGDGLQKVHFLIQFTRSDSMLRKSQKSTL